MFCPDCGIDHHAAERTEADAVKAEADRAVEIARLETKRDIEVARINAGAATAISETEAEADVARAEGIAEGMENVIDAATPDAPPSQSLGRGNHRDGSATIHDLNTGRTAKQRPGRMNTLSRAYYFTPNLAHARFI